MKVPIGNFRTTEAMTDNVNQVLKSGWLSPGPMVARFENAFANYHCVNHAVMCNSGTSALVVALQTLKELEGWKDGDEIICPAITFVATINAVLHCNLKPVLIDVDPVTYTLNPDLIYPAITSKTKAILPVHAFGLTADMGKILEFSDRYGIKIIEDVCEALGAKYDNRPAGSLGDIGCFSFYMSHHIMTGAGGMMITNSLEYANKMRSLTSHGWDRKVKSSEEFDFEVVKKRYYFTSIGHSFRTTELEAAIALPQLETLRDDIKKRVRNASALTAGLNKFSDKLQLPKCPYGRSHSLMMYPIMLKQGNKWDLIEYLEKAGIETREMLPLTNQPCYRGMFNENDYHVAKRINEQGFYIGCNQYLNENQIYYVIAQFEGYFNG